MKLVHDNGAKYNKYEFDGHECNFIYSFNSVFSKVDNQVIGSILDKTNF